MGACCSLPSDSSEENSQPYPGPSTSRTSSGGPTSNPIPPSAPSRLTRTASKGKKLESFLMRPNLGALRTYATLPNPNSSLPASTLLLSNRNTIAIFDAFPKAKFHFLVLPRHPFPPQSNPESKNSIIKLDLLDDLSTLLTKAPREVASAVINAMSETAREVEEMIRDEMIKTEGFEWRIHVGFHAIPSMKHIHLHIISDDRISDSLKTKKHHNSFRPDLGFFVSLPDVQRWLEQDDDSLKEQVAAMTGASTMLNTQLTCFKCDEPFLNMPELKKHLDREFQKEKRRALRRIAQHGQQHSDDDEI